MEWVITNFHGRKVSKENASYKSFSLLMLNSVIRVNKKCYPQIQLEEDKYEIKINKMDNFINHDLEQISFESEAGSNLDNETDNVTGNESDYDECNK